MQAPASPVLELAIADREPAVRRNAAEIASLAVTQITWEAKPARAYACGKLAQLAADEVRRSSSPHSRARRGAFSDERLQRSSRRCLKLKDDFPAKRR
jgi:hypothetical protein